MLWLLAATPAVTMHAAFSSLALLRAHPMSPALLDDDAGVPTIDSWFVLQACDGDTLNGFLFKDDTLVACHWHDAFQSIQERSALLKTMDDWHKSVGGDATPIREDVDNILDKLAWLTME
jgi:hypothetical protein